RLDGVDDALLGIEQVITKVEVGQVQLFGLAYDLVEQLDWCGELSHEGVLGARDGGLEFVALALELFGPVPSEFQRVLRGVGFVHEVSAERAERGPLAFVEGLLLSDHGVGVLLRVAERGGKLGALEDIAVDCEGDLGSADEEGDEYLNRGEVPAVRLC